MPIHTEPIQELKLESIGAVADWVRDTQDALQRIPLTGVLKHGATFRDDEYLGDGDTLFHFNRPGFQALCQRLGFRMDHLARLESPALASQVLNDLLSQRDVVAALADDDFVVDARTDTIIGIVSHTYVTYSNREFVADIESLINGMVEDQRLDFQEAYGINTELTLRFTSVKHHGTVRGRGGEGEDKSKLGLELRNSMVGDASIRVNYYLRRLICANGLMVPALDSVNRVFHSGHQGTLRQRLERSFYEVHRNLGEVQRLLATLGNLRFEPATLARTRDLADCIFDVIPGSKKMIIEQEGLSLRFPPNASAADREEMRREHDGRIIGFIPERFGGELSKRVFKSWMRDGVTLFDFVNVFTEYAKSKPPIQKLQIEEKAGTLAKYLATNARKL